MPPTASADAGQVFYRRALGILQDTRVPFLVGGAYAFAAYTGIRRDTRDFDVFIEPKSIRRLIRAFQIRGYRAEILFPHWLGKVYDGDRYVDLIYSSGNAVARVDELWFEHAQNATVLDTPVRLCPAEEMIWSKAFVAERERFDGADIAHLLRARADRLDWERLLERFVRHGRVLLAHLVLFGFIYPSERDRIPPWVMQRLIDRMDDAVPGEDRLCQGTLLSRSQFLPDLEQGYRDARLEPEGNMTREEIERWTRAAEDETAQPRIEADLAAAASRAERSNAGRSAAATGSRSSARRAPGPSVRSRPNGRSRPSR